MLRKLFNLIFPCRFDNPKCKDNLMGCVCGKGDEEEAPKFKENPQTTAIRNKIGGQVSGLLDTPYGEYEKRFTPSKQVTGALSDTLSNYQGLIDQTDYGLENYDQIEQDYLDSVTGAYREERGRGREQLQEELIGENLLESGPGFGLLGEFSEESAKGVAGLTAGIKREDIQRRFERKSYQSALQRGDYTTMFNMALTKGKADIAPAQQATDAQMGLIGPASGFFGQLQSGDINKYTADLDRYEAMLKPKKNLGGLATLAGAGVGAYFGGAEGAELGASLGGTGGSMIEY